MLGKTSSSRPPHIHQHQTYPDHLHTYSNTLTLTLCDCDLLLQNVVNGINNMTAEFATTRTDLALQEARNLLTVQGDPLAQKRIILLTDGEPRDSSAAVAEATLTKQAGES